MIKKLTVINLILISLWAKAAQAHPGHDHNSPMSFAEHTVFYISLGLLAAGTFYIIRKKYQSQMRKKKK